MNSDRLTWYVLSAVTPVYENAAGVESKVSVWGEEDGFAFGLEEIRVNLEDLIRRGAVSTWALASDAEANERVSYSSERYRNCWYLITQEGVDQLKALDSKFIRGRPKRV